MGNQERAAWFGAQGKVWLTVLAPHWPSIMATGQATHPPPESVTCPDERPQLNVVRYSAKPWFPYRLTRVPRRRALAEIDAILERERPDVVAVTDAERVVVFGAWAFPGQAYARRRGIPYIAHYHTDFLNFARTHPFWRLLRAVLFTHVIRHIYRRFDLTITATADAAARLRKLGISAVHQVAFIGIDVSDFRPDRSDPSGIAVRVHSWQPMDRTILSFGRLSREKRVDVVIRAFHELARSDPSLRLLIAGDGPRRVVSKLRRLAGGSDRIHFLGFVAGEERAKLFASCDVFCTASPYETFGRTVVEAMASGIPVVAVGSGAITDYLVSGRNCLLSTPGDPSALAAALRQALNIDMTAITSTAQRDSALFSVEAGCQHLLAFYQDLLCEPGTGLPDGRPRSMSSPIPLESTDPK